MVFGSRLRDLRKAQKLTREQLADKIGVTTRAVASWEMSDRLPSPDYMLWIADHFSVSLDYLFGRTDYPAFEWRNAKGETKEDEGMDVEEYHYTMNLTKEDMETIREFLALKNAEKKKDHAG